MFEVREEDYEDHLLKDGTYFSGKGTENIQVVWFSTKCIIVYTNPSGSSVDIYEASRSGPIDIVCLHGGDCPSFSKVRRTIIGLLRLGDPI